MRSYCRFALIATLVLLAPAAGTAQTRVGFRGGVTFATLSGADIDGGDHRVARNFGLFVTHPVSPVLSIQLGAGLASKGDDNFENDTQAALQLRYLEFPILARLSVPSEGDVGLNFFAGPVVSLRTSCTLEVFAGGADISANCNEGDVLAAGVLKKSDLGVIAGTGLEFSLDREKLVFVELRYNLGLTKLGDAGVNDDLKNRSFSLLAGLSFRLGR